MRIGEVCLLTNNVPRLADFYKTLLQTDNGSNDPIHQFILTEETSLTIYNDGEKRADGPQRVRLAFTVDNVDQEYERLLKLGTTIVSPPTAQPWGARNMTFYDPDHNLITFRTKD